MTDATAAIADVEAADGYRLTDRQREAVSMAISNPLSVISGGAGTGKTTVVKAILACLRRALRALPTNERDVFETHQLALAGRAAMRIAKATGEEATTIARFLHQIELGGRTLKRGMLIFDEASMLDVPSIYRILSLLPTEVDLLLIGDPAQLPPVGPGLLFHRMIGAPGIPQIELDVTHRQATSTGIPVIARSIRNGEMPDIPQFDPCNPLARGVFLLPTSPERVGEDTVRTFGVMAGQPPSPGLTSQLHDRDVQILGHTKNGHAGTKALNLMIEKRWMMLQPPIMDWGLSVGSKVLWLRNDYRKAPIRDSQQRIIIDSTTGEPRYAGFMNGSIGIIHSKIDGGAWVKFDDGTEDALGVGDLEKLTHGWAITVHKAQGSAFRRVIIPVVSSRLLDRTTIYTALTRAIDTAVLVAAPDVISAAIKAQPISSNRTVTLDFEQIKRDGT